MKRILLLTLLICSFLDTKAQGALFFQNISPAVYNAHKQNFDVKIDRNSIVYVANFEGLLYYDHAEWRKIHTPGITRVTVIFKDSKGKVWVGGYNFFGYVRINERGIPELKAQDDKHEFQGEVQHVWETGGEIFFSVSNGNVYTAKQNSIYLSAIERKSPYDYAPILPNVTVNWKEELGHGLTAVATDGYGVYITDEHENILYHLDEAGGLCSNNVKSLSYNQHGLLWGVTDNGLFVIQVPSPYTRLTPVNGLRGEVLSMVKIGEQMYAGTLNGLFRQKGHSFEPVEKISHACWQLISDQGGLLAATSDGVYRMHVNGSIQQLTKESATAILTEDNGFYSGELDGVYYHTPGKTPVKVSDAERVVKIMKDAQGIIWLQNLYGRIWNNKSGTFKIQTRGNNSEEISTLVMYNNRPTIIPASATEPFPYPLFSYTDESGVLWLTDRKGKDLYALVNGKENNPWSAMVYPLMDYSVRAVVHEGDRIWMGSSNGLLIADKSKKDPIKEITPKVFIRSIVINDDSIAWGGFGELPRRMIFQDDERQIRINYSADYSSLLLPTQYRYRINGGRWSAWDFDTFTEYNNQPYGMYAFEVQARDAFGRISETVQFSFGIRAPFYLRWYMILAYLILLGLISYATVLWRIRRLRKDKERLETVVQERTAEIVQQKNEIEEKSRSLETALNELGEAQHELVRQEKMATVGKLTQGLIDRILNPLNYINNFSKLSQGLVDDVTANIEDEKDHMDSENYEDTIDVLGMLKGNLMKVSEHGANTTRTLKSMEEMLKDRSGGITRMDIIPLVKQNEEMLNTYYEKEIKEHHIKTVFTHPDTPVLIHANAEQLSKTFMSLLGNAIYAVAKKASRNNYHTDGPEVDFRITPKDNVVEIIIRDNGIGIEDTIIHKIFDPFFTTKTTGEASGVGLYLSREIIQNYGGDISVKSQKNEYTEFSIILPTSND